MWEKRCGLIAAVLSLYISCNHGLEAEGADPVGISGRVRFVGEWPGDVAQVAVAVFRKPPASLSDFFNISGWDTDVPLGVEDYDFFVPLDGAGNYEWVIVAWRKQDKFWDFSSLLGCYHLPGVDLPAMVEVNPGEIVFGVDIDADFAVLEHVNDPGTSLCERLLSTELLAELGG